MKPHPLFKTTVLVTAILLFGLNPHAGAESMDQVHTPAPGTAERKGILDVLHREYTTGSGSAVKFQVKHLKVHNGWAWINVVPLDKTGTPEGDEWPSLLRYENGNWSLIDLTAAVQAVDESDGPHDPSPRFLKVLQKKYATLPADIVPVRQR